MKLKTRFVMIILLLCLVIPALAFAKPPDDSGLPDDYLGDLYGDLYVILRNVDGVPVLDDYGCVQPARVVGDESSGYELEVQPLYTNEAEDIYCELTDEMLAFVQEVDFGRLNLGRSPESVLSHAFDEAINALNASAHIQLDPAGRFLLTGDEGLKTIDSPLENLALYVKLMTDGHLITLDTDPVEPGGGNGGLPDDKGPPEDDGPDLEDRPILSDHAIDLLAEIGYGGLGDVGHVLNNRDLHLAASLLAAAADKSGGFTIDKVVYINSIYGINALGTLPGEDGDHVYFNFTSFIYNPEFDQRGSPLCAAGEVYVLQPAADGHWEEVCVSLVNSVAFKPVNFVVDQTPPLWGTGYWEFGHDNIAGFTQAANDALKIIEYIHNFSVPEELE